MADLDKGITRVGEGYLGKAWNILGQHYLPKASCDSTFAFETNSDPGQHVPWSKSQEGELVRMPRGVPHGYFNKSDAPARALFWVSPAGKLEALFEALHNLDDIPRVLQLSAEHGVDFLPPEASA